MFLAIR